MPSLPNTGSHATRSQQKLGIECCRDYISECCTSRQNLVDLILNREVANTRKRSGECWWDYMAFGGSNPPPDYRICAEPRVSLLLSLELLREQVLKA